jgi:hypothetical protein
MRGDNSTKETIEVPTQLQEAMRVLMKRRHDHAIFATNDSRTRHHHQSFANVDDCHVPPAEMDSRRLLGSGCFFARRPKSVALSRLSSNAPLLFT